jgi:uncharacterized membrane protein YkvA (DUF1232 family)
MEASLETRCLDAFPSWLRSLAQDVRELSSLLGEEGTAHPARARVIAALNYLFKSLDLIPDGLEDLGFIDDAFVLRASALAAMERDGVAVEGGILRKLSDEAQLIREFLGPDYERLERYLGELSQTSARGRKVSELLESAELRSDFVRELGQWADSYVAPSFTRDSRSLVKLRSFLARRLPQ